MTLQSSGLISFSQIQAELGGTNPISVSEYYRGGVYTTTSNTNVPTSGAISIASFYSAQGEFLLTLSSDTQEANLSTLATTAGWDGVAPVLVTISSGVYVWSNDTSVPGLLINIPGCTVTNNGYIIGKGGQGGSSTVVSGSGHTSTDYNGLDGGNAISVTTTGVTIINNTGAFIAAGGGGGGGSRMAGGGGGAGGGRGGHGKSFLGSYPPNTNPVGSAGRGYYEAGSTSYLWSTAGNKNAGSGGGGGGSEYTTEVTAGAGCGGASGGRILPGTGSLGGLSETVGGGAFSTVRAGSGGDAGNNGGDGNNSIYGAGGGGGGWGADGGRGDVGSSSVRAGGTGGTAISGFATLTNNGTKYG